MKKKKKERRHFKEDESEIEKKKMTEAQFKEAKRNMLLLILNTVLFVGVYFYLNSIEFWPVFFIYAAATAGFSIGYLIYNRGFARENVTMDMLPATMSQEEKEKFFKSRDERKQKSKWMLTIIFPCIITFFLDIIALYFLPYFENLLK